VQAASGLAFGAFTALHLVNQWLAPLGPEAYDGYQAAARAVYQQPAGYALLAVSFGHVVATRGPSLALGFHPGFAGISFSLWWLPGVFLVYDTLFGAAALYHGGSGTLLTRHALGLRRDASLPGGSRGLLVPVAAGTVLLLLALLASGGRLFPIADPTQNPYARMWQGYGVSLEAE
jgi:hypothetical protein